MRLPPRVRQFAIALAAIAVVAMLVLEAAPRLLLSAGEQRDYETLRRADMFAGPAVGFAGVVPDEIQAFRRLSASPFGPMAFRYVLLRGSTAGKLYALTGLRRTSPMAFTVLVQPFRLHFGHVPTMFGCLVRGEPARHIVAAPVEHPVRLRSGETLEQWSRRTHPIYDARPDIIGGGFTSMFLDPPTPPAARSAFRQSAPSPAAPAP